MAAEQALPVLTLKERIAALQLTSTSSKPFVPPSPSEQRNGKKRPPPLPPKRPTKPSSNEEGNSQKSPPPSLPPRRPSQPTSAKQPPLLPSRRTGPSMPRKRSNESIASVPTCLSVRSSGCTSPDGNLATAPKYRVKDPEYDAAKRPALPEQRSMQQEQSRESEPGLPLRPTISAPERYATRNQKPILPPPSLPAAPPEHAARRDQKPVLPPPSLPSKRSMNECDANVPPKPRASALRFGFDTATCPPPIPSTRPQVPSTANPLPVSSPTKQTAVVELDGDSFDAVVLRSGQPVFVDFYAPFCKYCKELDPIYEELAIKYSSQPITIAKIDSYTHKEIGERYQIESWPTLKFFDGRGGPPVNFQWKRDMEWMSRFLDEQLEELGVELATEVRPPFPVSSKPNLAELMKSKPRF